MRSKELADLAGVTVRTLRHYHQIGLIAEPARHGNGYRRYGVQHLVRLLRIRRLSALGLSLDDIPALLDGKGERRSDMLDQLDESLTRQIQHLEAQRRTVAALRDSEAPLDMPPDIANSLLPLEVGRSAGAIRSGREQSILLARTVAADGREAIARLYDRLAEPDIAAVAQELGQRFDRLDDQTSEAEILDLAKAYVGQFGPWIGEYNQLLVRYVDGDTATLLSAHAMDVLTPQQRRFVSELTARMAEDGEREAGR